MTSSPSCSSSLSNEELLAINWQRFNRMFPTEQHCMEELLKRIHAGKLCCHICQNQEITREFGDRVYYCNLCKRSNSLTTGTFFHRIRFARHWLAAIWLRECGVTYSAHRLHALLQIAYATAHNAISLLNRVILKNMCREIEIVPSSLFTSVFGKRSRETPAGMHPAAEEDAVEVVPRKKAVDNSAALKCIEEGLLPSTAQDEFEECSSGFDSNNLDRICQELSGQPTSFDGLCIRTGLCQSQVAVSLTILELDGLALRLPGDRYVRGEVERQKPSLTLSKESELAVAGFCSYIRMFFHRISRKYLQSYLASYWCHLDRICWTNGALMRACLSSGRISCRDRLFYVSPALVKIHVSKGK